MTTATELNDYRWLISDDAAPWLVRGTHESTDLMALTRGLRRDLGPARTHLVLEQAALRRRAAEKFPNHAAKMFFTAVGLEQATDDQIARYKAQRFATALPAGGAIADICCGIGGDLMALARTRNGGAVRGIDRDPIVGLFAEANVRTVTSRCDVLTLACDARDVKLQEYVAWHVDPDRRADGHRTTRLETYEPPLDWLTAGLKENSDAAIKLAPASDVPNDWHSLAQREWIGSRRECRQQVAWFGRLASHPGKRSATIVGRDDASARTVVDDGDKSPPPFVTSFGRYLHEPHAAVLAARLVPTLAREHALSTFCDDAGYLTSDREIHDTALATFEILEIAAIDLRTLRDLVRQRNIGRLEIKKRGVDISPERLRRNLRLVGSEEATLALVPTQPHPRAILCRRCATTL